MKIQLTCKLFDTDASYFLNAITDYSKVESITVFRDKKGISNPKVRFRTSYFNNTPFRFIFRFFQMLFAWDKSSVIIGIYEMPHGLLAYLIGRLKGKPTVISVIGNPKLDRRNKGVQGWIVNSILKSCDAITVTGSVGRRYYINDKKYKAEKVFVLPNSVPLEEYLLKEGKIEKEYDLITLGRLSPEKGLLNLLEIVDLVRKKVPRIKLGIAGKGPQTQELQLRIKELKLEQNVILLGYVESASEFLKSGKIFITTSFTEGLPRTAIQSMLGGVPVIASNVGDMSDLVINGKTGVLVSDPENKLDFVNGVLNMLQEEEIYQLYSRNAIEHTKMNYSHAAATNVWNNIFEYLRINK